MPVSELEKNAEHTSSANKIANRILIGTSFNAVDPLDQKTSS